MQQQRWLKAQPLQFWNIPMFNRMDSERTEHSLFFKTALLLCFDQGQMQIKRGRELTMRKSREKKGKQEWSQLTKGPKDTRLPELFFNKCPRNYFCQVIVKTNFWILKWEEVKWLSCEECWHMQRKCHAVGMGTFVKTKRH